MRRQGRTGGGWWSGCLSMAVLAGLAAPGHAQSPPEIAAELDGLFSESEEAQRAAAARVGEALDTLRPALTRWATALPRERRIVAFDALMSYTRVLPDLASPEIANLLVRDLEHDMVIFPCGIATCSRTMWILIDLGDAVVLPLAGVLAWRDAEGGTRGLALDTHYATSVVWVLARIGTDDAVAAIRSFQRRLPEIPIDPTSLGEARGVIDEEDPYEAIQLEVEAALEYARDRQAER